MHQEVFRHYTLGIQKIDQEHLDLINLMERIMECAKCEDHETCDITSDMLRVKFEQHLRDEEAYMYRIGYPYINAHIEYHDTIRKELEEVISKMRENSYKPNRWITQKLRDIFVKHIDEQDLQIAHYINKTRM